MDNIALINAVIGNDIHATQALLKQSNINSTDKRGNTALMSATSHANTSIAISLLSIAEIDINAINNNGDSALILAIHHRNTALAQILLAQVGININVIGSYGNSALILAVMGSNTVIVQNLLSVANVDVNAANNKGDTALILAARHGNTTIVQSLLEKYGINLYARDYLGHTARINAAIHCAPTSKIITALEMAEKRQGLIKKYQDNSQLTHAQAWAATMPEMFELPNHLPLTKDLILLTMTYLAPISFDDAKKMLPHLKSVRSDYARLMNNLESLRPCHTSSSAIATLSQTTSEDTLFSKYACCIIT